jgi:hypothetical protein
VCRSLTSGPTASLTSVSAQSVLFVPSSTATANQHCTTRACSCAAAGQGVAEHGAPSRLLTVPAMEGRHTAIYVCHPPLPSTSASVHVCSCCACCSQTPSTCWLPIPLLASMSAAWMPHPQGTCQSGGAQSQPQQHLSFGQRLYCQLRQPQQQTLPHMCCCTTKTEGQPSTRLVSPQTEQLSDVPLPCTTKNFCLMPCAGMTPTGRRRSHPS